MTSSSIQFPIYAVCKFGCWPDFGRLENRVKHEEKMDKETSGTETDRAALPRSTTLQTFLPRNVNIAQRIH